mgnify:FL=1|jgi:putative SOS response-associated peptidase YedK
MCGRYYVSDRTARKIEKMIQNSGSGIGRVPQGDIHPAEDALAFFAGNNSEDKTFDVKLFSWGFKSKESGGLIINARVETVQKRAMFRDSIRSRRCFLPASSFYEWNSEKEKFTYTRPDGDTIFLAGFYQLFDDRNHFVILTTAPNNSVAKVHDRMPLILEKKQLGDWIYDVSAAEQILKQVPVQLESSTEYEQQTLKFD